jgi:hypothetical protein
MFSPSEARPRTPGAGAEVVPLRSPAVDPITLLTALAAVAATAAALLMPMQAEAGRVDTPNMPPPERTSSTTAEQPYQLRCWQYGRLLFEERALQLSPDTVEGLKLSGTDRRRQPVMVTDTGNATCLIRRAPAPRHFWP